MIKNFLDTLQKWFLQKFLKNLRDLDSKQTYTKKHKFLKYAILVISFKI
jgi:hypothetical protein